MIKYNIGKVVKALSLSGRQFAKLAKISPNTAALLIKAESQKDYSVSTALLDRICAVLGKQPGNLLKYIKG